MHSYISLFIGEFKLNYLLQKRYFFDLLASTMNVLLFLVFIQLGIHSFNGEVDTTLVHTKLAHLIIGFFCFLNVSNAIGSISYTIIETAKTGILEQLFLSPFGVIWVMLSKAFVSTSTMLLINSILLPISMAICSHWFFFNIPNFMILLPPLWFSSWGIGFVIGAFSVIFKKTEGFLNLTQFLILSLLVLPSYPFTYVSLLPIAPESATLIKSLSSNSAISLTWIAYLYVHSLLWLVLGIRFFKWCELYAKDRGLLGQY